MKTLIVAITGPSDFGKGRIIERLLNDFEEFERIISHTDRPIREIEEEQPGAEYHFVNDKEFSEMIQAEKFVEWQVVPSNGYRYGKTWEEVQKALETYHGKVILTRVNVINLPVFKRHFPNSKSIFIDVRDTSALIEYLKKNPEVMSEEEFDRRYKFATEERRRRHLADITIARKENEDEIIHEILRFVNQYRG